MTWCWTTPASTPTAARSATATARASSATTRWRSPPRQVLGLAHQILYCHPPRGTKRQRPGPAGRLWRDAVAAIPSAPPGRRYVHLADRAADTTELLDYAWEHGLG